MRRTYFASFACSSLIDKCSNNCCSEWLEEWALWPAFLRFALCFEFFFKFVFWFAFSRKNHLLTLRLIWWPISLKENITFTPITNDTNAITKFASVYLVDAPWLIDYVFLVPLVSVPRSVFIVYPARISWRTAQKNIIISLKFSM